MESSSTNVTSQITERAQRKSSKIGEASQEEMLKELPGTDTEMEKARINKVRNQSNERVSYNPQLVGSVQDQETPEIFQSKFEVKSDTATSGKVKSKSSDRAVKRSTTRGYVPEHEATQDYTQVDQKLENVKSSTIRKSSTERPAVMSQNVVVL